MQSTPPTPQPVDILFAQKASSCVKAAGMDPRQMDLKRFYELAAVIITRAYLGIYKEPLPGIIADPQNDDDLVTNAHKVINGLISKTNDHNLMEISGRDIVSGNQRAVGILVSVLYSEGNRMWLRKLHKVDDNGSAVDDNDIGSGNNQRKKTAMRPSDRHGTRSGKKSSCSESDAEKSVFDEELDRIIAGDDGDSRTEAYGGGDLKSNSARDSYNNYRDEYNGGGRSKKYNRPTSAPSRSKSGHRGRIAQAQAAAVERLFSAGKYKNILLARLADQAMSRDRAAKAALYGNRQQGGDKDDEAPYTYDMKSGRKVIISKAYLDSVAKQRKLDALNNVKKISEIGRGMHNDSGPPPPPGQPEWPGRSTGASVDKWIKRMTTTTDDEVNPALTRPRTYGAYQLIEKLDMVISVEHCYNCAHHSLSLRHDPKEYMLRANEYLRTVAQLAHESGVCARVGVTRMRARITTKCKHTDVDSRIGACEVQIAFKDSKGVIQSELLHSKLLSRHWPSKSAIEKKLKEFLLHSGVAIHPMNDPTTCSQGVGTDGLSSYPIGAVGWDETPLKESHWVFPAGRPVGMVDLNCQFEKVDNPADKSLNIQWVFDARSISGVVQKPPQVHQLPPAPSTPEPSLKPRRPQSASTVRPPPSSKATAALARLNAKSPRNAEPASAFFGDSAEEPDSPGNDPTRSNDSGDDSSSDDVMKLLKAMASKSAPSGAEDEPLLPYDIGLLVKRGIMAAETIASCVLLRQSVIAVSVAQRERAKGKARDVTPESIESGVGSVFRSIDRKGASTLDIDDLDNVLTLMQNRRCSDQALRLVMLSIDTCGSGEISFPQFLSFVGRHEEKFDPSLYTKKSADNQKEDEVDDIDELGVLWMQIVMHLHGSSPEAPAAGIQKFVKELAACVSDPSGDGVCAEQVFIAALEESGLASILSPDGLILLRNAFGQRQNMAMIKIMNFSTWLLADGIDVSQREGASMPTSPTAATSSAKGDGTMNFNTTLGMPDLHTFYPTSSAEDAVFEDRELEFDRVVVEGAALAEKALENLQVSVLIGKVSYIASISAAKERSTIRRSFKVDWTAAPVSAESFKDKSKVVVSMTTAEMGADQSIARSSVPLANFMAAIGSPFEVCVIVKLPSPSGEACATQDVKITLSGTAREASEAAQKRMSVMKPSDLVKVKFEPLPLDDLDLSAPSSPTSMSPKGNKEKFNGAHPEESIDLGIIGGIDHQYMKDDFEDILGESAAPSEIESMGGSKDRTPDRTQYSKAISFKDPTPAAPTSAAVTRQAPPSTGETPKAKEIQQPVPTQKEASMDVPKIEKAASVKEIVEPISNSVETTQEDDEGDDYEVDFEDFVED